MSDFDGRDLYVGTIRGRRTWNVDSLGRLVGVSYPAVWIPGENVAKHAGLGSSGPHLHFAPGGMVMAAQTRAWLGLAHHVIPVGATQASSAPEHDFSECGNCGFYAYYEDERRWSSPGVVSGVIEAYGTVHRGTHGFRAEKAKIVALCVEQPKRMPVRRLLRWIYDEDIEVGVTAGGFLAGGALLIAGSGTSHISALLAVPLLILAAICGAVIAAGLVAMFFGHDLGYARKRPNDLDADLIARNYPGIPIYRSREAMHRDFPADTPEPISPETDPDFWSRRAP